MWEISRTFFYWFAIVKNIDGAFFIGGIFLFSIMYIYAYYPLHERMGGNLYGYNPYDPAQTLSFFGQLPVLGIIIMPVLFRRDFVRLTAAMQKQKKSSFINLRRVNRQL